MKNVTVYIPTRGRWERQPTLEALPKSWLSRTRLVVDPYDVKEYYPRHGKKVKLLAPKALGIHKVRQWIVDNCETECALMLSDDLKFFHRSHLNEKGTYYHLQDCDEAAVDDLLQWLVDSILQAGYTHAGVSQRQVNHATLEPVAYVTRMHDAYAYNIRVLREGKFRFDRLNVMEDLDMTLQLFEKGHPNAVSFYYAWDQKHSNAEGGCSIYRNNELQTKCAHWLAKLHPETVKVVEKETKSWKGMETRTDVRVAWKKAYSGDLSEFDIKDE